MESQVAFYREQEADENVFFSEAMLSVLESKSRDKEMREDNKEIIQLQPFVKRNLSWVLMLSIAPDRRRPAFEEAADGQILFPCQLGFWQAVY